MEAKINTNYKCEECGFVSPQDITNETLKNNKIFTIECPNCNFKKEIKSEEYLDYVKKEVMKELQKKFK